LFFQFNIFPDAWKISKVVPVFKKGDIHDIENFRQISLLNNFSKVFEFVFFQSLYMLSSKAVFICTVINLMVVTQFIADCIDNRSQTDVVYLDFSKAFDKISHTMLLIKLDCFDFS
jgi:hypothetical protein